METTTKFSIITITYNNRDGLSRTAESIQKQTNTHYQWIIIDGASTDGTRDDFVHYTSATIISERDNGIYDAMNKGINNATGDYLIFMNAGDAFASSDILEKVFPLTQSNPDFIYGDSREDNHYKRARSYLKINWGMFTHHQAMLYRRESLGNLRYDLNYKIAADYDLTLQFLFSSPLGRGMKGEGLITYIPIPICIFETGGVSQTNAKQGRDEQFISRQKNKSCGQFQNYLIRLIQLFRYKIRKYIPLLYWNLIRDSKA